MFREGPAVDEDVVKEDKHEAPEERPEHLIHQSLKGGRRVRQAKGNDQELEVAVVGA
jgi:hypothetical protein